jgi:plasmid stability protein
MMRQNYLALGVTTMADRIILDLSDELYSAIQERAVRNNRSIEAEIIDILEAVALQSYV